MTKATATEALLLELDDKTWHDQLDRAESWFGNVLMTQSKYRKLAESTAEKIDAPHIKQYLRELAAVAREHEGKAEDLFAAIGRAPSRGRSLLGAAVSKGSEVVADLVGLAGGATGGWKDLRQLLLDGLDAMGAFAIAEQIGLALGLVEITDLVFPIVLEKSKHQLLLQEYMLEMGPVSILLQSPA